jgi:hypothetical protein
MVGRFAFAVLIGIWSLVAQTDAKGAFKFQSVASGRYRLVVQYAAFSPANAILLMRPAARRSLRVHMKPAGIDTGSYVD